MMIKLGNFEFNNPSNAFIIESSESGLIFIPQNALIEQGLKQGRGIIDCIRYKYVNHSESFTVSALYDWSDNETGVTFYHEPLLCRLTNDDIKNIIQIQEND